MMKKLLALLVFSLPMATWATHSLGGEFRYGHLQGLSYSVEFHYWTCLEAPADRPELIFHFGDGSMDTVPRISITDTPAGPGCCGVRYNVYSTTHTYPSPGIYTMTMEDFARSTGILNIPNSASQSFCTSATLNISPLTANNSSVVFGSALMDWDYVWSTLVHDPMPMDADGDSLSFELVTPLGLNCEPIAGYTDPTSPPPGWTWLDPATGIYSWHLPNTIGRYTIAIRATEWRMVGGTWTYVGELVRDMTLCLPTLPTSLAALSSTTAPALRPTLCEGTLWVTNPEGTSQWMQIMDAAGREVFSFVAPPGEHAIDVSILRPAMYLIRSANWSSTRFIRQ